MPGAWHPAWLLPMTGFDVEMGLRQAAALGDAALAGSKVWGPKGCLRCAGRGYSGRVGVFELFAPDAECAAAIAAGTHASDLFAMARRKGMRTLADDARAKCLDGVTTVSEALRVVAQ